MNCKNCGAPIGKDGFCGYCNSYYKAEDYSHKSRSFQTDKQSYGQTRWNIIRFIKNQSNFSEDRMISDVINYRLRDMCVRYIRMGMVDASECYERERLIHEYNSYGKNAYVDALIKQCKDLPILG